MISAVVRPSRAERALSSPAASRSATSVVVSPAGAVAGLSVVVSVVLGVAAAGEVVVGAIAVGTFESSGVPGVTESSYPPCDE